MGSLAYKEVLRLYEADRKNARKLYEARKEEVYSRIPQIRELDESLTRLSLEAVKGLLGTGPSGGGNRGTDEAKRRIGKIMGEKLLLMEQAGFSENYLSDIYTCQYCQDTGYIDVQKCQCLRQRLIDWHYSTAGLGDTLSEENFQNFEFKYYSAETDPETGLSPLLNIRNVYSYCVDFVMDFGTEFSNLLFYGDAGLGKTFLCNCIARDLLDAGASVLYTTAPRLFKKIEDFRFNRNEQTTLDRQHELVYDTDLLIIDDLGSEFSTVVTDTELFSIINSRLLARRPTVISTNLSLNDFQNAYTNRIVSRIMGSYKMLRLFGDDIRVKKKLLALGGVKK